VCFFLFSFPFCFLLLSVVVFVVFVALARPQLAPGDCAQYFFTLPFSYSGRRRHRGRRGHANDQSNLVTGKKERDTAVQDFCLFFFPFFSAALRIYLSIYLLSLPSVSFVSRRFLLIFMATTDCRVASCCCREGYLNLLAYSSSSSPEYSILLLLVSNCDGGVAHESAAAAADDDDDDAFGLKLGFEI
jgi:hypothetical protein